MTIASSKIDAPITAIYHLSTFLTKYIVDKDV